MMRCTDAREPLAHRDQIKGRNLAFWCALPEPGRRDICHADALLRFSSE
jgi:hypothetical protein